MMTEVYTGPAGITTITALARQTNHKIVKVHRPGKVQQGSYPGSALRGSWRAFP